MVIGQLVKEDCSNPDKCRLGTMVKVTKYNLASNSDWHKLTTHVFYDGIEGSVMNLMAGNTIMAIL
jgi:hypothetical protein